MPGSAISAPFDPRLFAQRHPWSRRSTFTYISWFNRSVLEESSTMQAQQPQHRLTPDYLHQVILGTGAQLLLT